MIQYIDNKNSLGCYKMAITLIKVENVKEVSYAIDKDGNKSYYVRLKHHPTIYPQVNYTKIFELSKYRDDDKEHLKQVVKKRDYVHSVLENNGKYVIDDIKGITKKKEIAEISKAEDKKIELTFDNQFNRIINILSASEEIKKIKIYNYKRHIQPYIGGMNVYEIKYKDIKKIFDIMNNSKLNGTKREIKNEAGKTIQKYEAKKLAVQTQKNILSILKNVFNDLIMDDEDFADFYGNPTLRMKDYWKDKKEEKFAPIDYRLKTATTEDLLDIARKIYQSVSTIKAKSQTKVYLYTFLMTARRPSELRKIHKNDIKEDLVFVSSTKTKTKIYEKFYIPNEVITLKDSLNEEFPLGVSETTAFRMNDKIRQATGLTDTEFRSYDFRHLFVNILSKEFNRHEVSLCISHTSGDETKSNDHYFVLPLERRKLIFERYWELIRQPIGTRNKPEEIQKPS